MPPEAFILIAAPPEDLCLAFVNTRYWRGSPEPTEELRGPDDLVIWSRAHAVAASSLDNAAFDEAIALREALFRLFAAMASGLSVPDVDLERFNAALAAAELRQRMVWHGGAFAWVADRSKAGMAAMLSPVLWSAADLMTGGRRSRVRQCDNPKCRFLFLDDSKSGNRRWCSMASCGNRAKAHRHYLKRKGET